MLEVIDEMFGLSVFLLIGMNGERFFGQRIWIALAQLGKFNFSECVQADICGVLAVRYRPDRKHYGQTDNKRAMHRY